MLQTSKVLWRAKTKAPLVYYKITVTNIEYNLATVLLETGTGMDLGDEYITLEKEKGK